MSARFGSQFADEFAAFLDFKHALGYPYRRAEFTLRNFDRYVQARADGGAALTLDGLVLGWLASAAGRKPVSVTNELAVIRQFCLFRRRSCPDGFVPGRVWAPQSTESRFLAHIFSDAEIHTLLALTATLNGSPFRAPLYHTLISVLYCTGLRFGEAVRLRLKDVDLDETVLFIDQSKGRSRLVPFGDDLGQRLRDYLAQRLVYAPCKPDEQLFVRADGNGLSVKAAHATLCQLFRKMGIKPAAGRVGPRPYDFRHTFAVHRLTRWYRDGVDIQTQLPLLSAYMGHYDLLGTETYLQATPELLALTSDRFEARLNRKESP